MPTTAVKPPKVGTRVWVCHLDIAPKRGKPMSAVVRERVFYGIIENYLRIPGNTRWAIGPLNKDTSYCVAYNPAHVFLTEEAADFALCVKIRDHVNAVGSIPITYQPLKK